MDLEVLRIQTDERAGIAVILSEWTGPHLSLALSEHHCATTSNSSITWNLDHFLERMRSPFLVDDGQFNKIESPSNGFRSSRFDTDHGSRGHGNCPCVLWTGRHHTIATQRV